MTYTPFKHLPEGAPTAVPCRTGCGRLTNMTGTKLCDPCWELRRLLSVTPPEAVAYLLKESKLSPKFLSGLERLRQDDF